MKTIVGILIIFKNSKRYASLKSRESLSCESYRACSLDQRPNGEPSHLGHYSQANLPAVGRVYYIQIRSVHCT